MDNSQPIIVKRVKKIAAGHHGGAWKIAFADFATAMMAFFLVMWLLSAATPEQMKAISGYFQDPIGFTTSASPYVIDLGGSPTPSPNRTLNPESEDSLEAAKPSPPDGEYEAPKSLEEPEAQADPGARNELADQLDQARLDLLLQELQNKIHDSPPLRPFLDQIALDITPDGLRIQIRDAEQRPMFESGSAQLQPYFEDILLAMVETLQGVPNKLSIAGHTDAQPFSSRSIKSNWELSSDRANAARRALVKEGLPERQVARVVGYAATNLYDRQHPASPINRRIEILVLSRRAQQAIEAEGGPSPASNPQPSSGGRAQGSILSPQDLQRRLNIFEDGVLSFDQDGEASQ